MSRHPMDHPVATALQTPIEEDEDDASVGMIPWLDPFASGFAERDDRRFLLGSAGWPCGVPSITGSEGCSTMWIPDGATPRTVARTSPIGRIRCFRRP